MKPNGPDPKNADRVRIIASAQPGARGTMVPSAERVPGPASPLTLGAMERFSRPIHAQTIEGAVAGDAAGVVWIEQLALRYLEPGEIIELAVRPSRWSVLFTSFRWLLVCVLLALAAPFLSAQIGLTQSQIGQGVVALALARIIFGIAQWFGILYILTNRRVLSVRGLFRPHAVSTLLTEIRAIHLFRSWYERLVGVGTITIVTDEFSHLWIHLRDSRAIRDKLLRFVSRT